MVILSTIPALVAVAIFVSVLSLGTAKEG